jgi:rfaE bifunctional protein nucleotidyltransferase chain/domain
MEAAPALVARSRVASLAERLRRRRKKIVFTNGVFDVLHRGHVAYLQKARSFGDVLIIGLNNDRSARRLKGPGRPVQKQRDRAAVLLALRSVDYVVIFGEDRPERLVRQVRPDVLVKGADYKVSEIAGAEFVKAHGGRVCRIRLTPGRSSSDILAKARRSRR